MAYDLPARMLRLLSLLQTRRSWAGHELAERLEVTLRTVRRDIERLRTMGYPVESVTGPVGGYRLASGADMPPLLLEDDEAVAIAVALRTASSGVATMEDTALRALAKLEQVLPNRLRHRVSAVAAATNPMRPLPWNSTPRTDPSVLAALAAACRDREIIGFDYRTRATDRRRTEPYALVFVTAHWYLLGYDTHHRDWRIYRADRITEPTPTRHRFTPRELPNRDPAAYVAARLAEAPTRYRLQVTVALDPATTAARAFALPDRVHALDDHTSRVELSSDNPRDIAAQLLGLASHTTTITGTPELATHLEQLGEFLRHTAHTLTTPTADQHPS
ncbi:helix-turn-helix transcriptional regulator [Nocardia brasiliensis]|uniref:helix-turn-helix transcriptional regulator n=1 Tax=Nocardia brasiliensis TaxID=37326 RepID=UPI001894BF58|nr:WYL domain-containing protein [Nocardia brasiliensis]MBF6128168.1 WYL domain-containing protein [Nocardia brasiliensis]